MAYLPPAHSTGPGKNPDGPRISIPDRQPRVGEKRCGFGGQPPADTEPEFHVWADDEVCAGAKKRPVRVVDESL